METNQNKPNGHLNEDDELNFLNWTNFNKDIKDGKEGETIFEKWCKKKNYRIENVTNNPDYRKSDIDYLLYYNESIIAVDIKYNYYGDFYIFIEEHSNHPKKDGWFYKSKAKWIIMINKNNNNEFIFMNLGKMRQWFKDRYYPYTLNKPSYSKYGMWQSSYTKIPILDIPSDICVIKNNG